MICAQVRPESKFSMRSPLKRCAPGEAVVFDEIFTECRLQATSIFIAEVSWRLWHGKFQSLVQSWENVLISICLAQLCDLEGNLEHDGVRYNNVFNWVAETLFFHLFILCAVVLHRWVPKRNEWPLRCRTDPVTVTFHFSQVLEGTKHLCGYCRFFWRSRVEGVGLDGNPPTWWQRDLVNENNPSWWILF